MMQEDESLNKYEAMFIFPEIFKDEELEAAVDKVKGEIEKLGGVIESTIRLGRRPFAREIKKQSAGLYNVLQFTLPGSEVSNLRARLKFNEDIFRVEIYRAPEVAPVAAAAVAEGA